jgi:hypothetical protein
LSAEGKAAGGKRECFQNLDMGAAPIAWALAKVTTNLADHFDSLRYFRPTGLARLVKRPARPMRGREAWREDASWETQRRQDFSSAFSILLDGMRSLARPSAAFPISAMSGKSSYYRNVTASAKRLTGDWKRSLLYQTI